MLPLHHSPYSSYYRIRTCASRLHASMLPLHQTDFTKYRPYSLLALHGFLFRYCPTPLLTLCRCFRRAGYRNRTGIISPWRGDAIPLGESCVVITVGFEPTSFIPTRTNTLRIMTFRAYPYLHYRIVLHYPQVYPGIHPDALLRFNGLVKLTCFYHWSGWSDSNARSHAPKACALDQLGYIPIAGNILTWRVPDSNP